MRGAGRVLLDRHQAEEIVLRTGPYAFTVRAAETTPHGVRQVSVELPSVDFCPTEPIVADATWPFLDRQLSAYHATRHVSALAVPNSHLVTVLDDFYSEADLIATGSRVASNPEVFPIGANVSFVRYLAGAEAFIHTFERGAGLTPSCGSGVVASRAVLSQLGLVTPEVPVVVRNPGGVARSWLETSGGGWRPVLEGNATMVYATELDAAALLGEGPINYEGSAYLDEVEAFAALNGENLKALQEAGIESAMQGPTVG